jgi:hypothetical protein
VSAGAKAPPKSATGNGYLLFVVKDGTLKEMYEIAG